MSGFIITNQFIKSNNHRSFRDFISKYFQRRIMRIEPPYFILLTITFLFIKLTKYVPPVSQRFWQAPHSIEVSYLTSIIYLHGLIFGTFPRLFPPGWSLEIEVQFYLIAPLLFLAYFSLRQRKARAAIGAAILGCAVAVSVALPSSTHAPFLQRSLLVNLPQFWLGVLLADFQGELRNGLQGRERIAAALGWGGVILFVGWDVLWRVAGPYGGLAAQLALLLGIFLMFCGVFNESSFRRFCSVSIISIFGGACYSVYLTHIQVMEVLTPKIVQGLALKSFASAYPLTLVIELPLLLVVAMTFYVCLERPFMAVDWPARLWVRLRCLGPGVVRAG